MCVGGEGEGEGGGDICYKTGPKCNVFTIHTPTLTRDVFTDDWAELEVGRMGVSDSKLDSVIETYRLYYDLQ